MKIETDEYGNKFWKNKSGEFHRLDGAAIEYANGSKCWYINGKHHRTDGPAVEYRDGSKEWYLDGKCHRLDGPAIDDADGYKSWFVNGKLHRKDGPAIEWANGNKEWYIDGIALTEEEFDNWVRNNGTDWNEELKTLFDLTFK